VSDPEQSDPEQSDPDESEVRLPQLLEAAQESADPGVERAWLLALAATREPVETPSDAELHTLDLSAVRELARRRLAGRIEDAARFGSPLAARVVNRQPVDAPRALHSQGLPAHGIYDIDFGRWRAGFVYYHAALRRLFAWWEAKGEALRGSIAELRPALQAAERAFRQADPEREQEAAVWARSCDARGELLDGRHPEAGRALLHLCRATGQLISVVGPVTPAVDGNEEDPRGQRLNGLSLEVREAICGVVYFRAAAAGREPEPTEFSELIRSYEQHSAEVLVRWLLSTP